MRGLLALLVLLAACGTPAADVTAPATDPATQQPARVAESTEGTTATAGSGSVPAALDWTVASVDGGQIEGGDLAGRDVVLWFWAPW